MVSKIRKCRATSAAPEVEFPPEMVDAVYAVYTMSPGEVVHFSTVLNLVEGDAGEIATLVACMVTARHLIQEPGLYAHWNEEIDPVELE